MSLPVFFFVFLYTIEFVVVFVIVVALVNREQDSLFKNYNILILLKVMFIKILKTQKLNTGLIYSFHLASNLLS